MAVSTVIPEPLSAKYVGTFAYRTVKDRLPVILTHVVDLLFRERNNVASVFGHKATAETKDVIGRLSKLRNEMQTNKPVIPLLSKKPDAIVWNTFRENYINSTGDEPLWFEAPWLYVECYMYRRIKEAFELTSSLQLFDPFRCQKESSFTSSLSAVNILSAHLLKVTTEGERTQEIYKRSNFMKFVELSLWGNKCDLSLSNGIEVAQTLSPLEQLKDLRPNILVNHSEALWDILLKANETHPHSVQLHVVLDNAGFELFTDLCLVDYLLEMGLVAKAFFYVKELPWFVSDTLAYDFHWLLYYLKNRSEEYLTRLGSKWTANICNQKWEIVLESFWTLPNDFSDMKSVDPDLYATLSTADLILFKGDLNYRKLTGDLSWKHTTSFKTALRGFSPAPLCSLRTIKADVLVGLDEGLEEKVSSKYPTWLESGQFAVIQCEENI